MHRKAHPYLLLLLAAFACRMPAQTGSQPQTPMATQDSANDLFVTAGKSVVVDSARPIERVAVGSSDLAEATAVSPTEVLINGKAAGETSLILWQAGGNRQFFNLRIRPSSFASDDRLDALRREIRAELPGQKVQMTSENGLVFLHGTVRDMTSADRAVKIASTAGKVVNLLYVDVPKAESQILLKVRFASVDRTLTRQLGLNLFSTGATNTIGSVTTQQFSPPSISTGGGQPTTATLSNLLNIYLFRPDINLGATIEALEAQNLLQVLAEPNVLTANGKQGSFLAGGEYPYPVVQGTTVGGAGAITIEFRQFGILLNFIPTITPRGSIRLQVAPEVSSLDFANGVSLSGVTIPGLSTRKVNTEVELNEGQSFVIGGLLDNRETRNFSKIPFIGDVPILGKFFQSVQTTKSNTELIVIVTPEIVSPIPKGVEPPSLHYPDSFLQANTGTPMQNPVGTGGAPSPVPMPVMPIEDLQNSMRPEQPLNTNTTTPNAYFGGPQNGAAAGGSPGVTAQ